MRKITGRLLAFGMILCLLTCAGLAAADGMHREVRNDTLEVEVVPGYNGMITYGKTVPVRVTVRNHGGDLNAVAAVNAYVSNVKYDRFETEIHVPAGGERTVVMPVKAEVRQETFTVEIVADGQVICAVNAAPSGTVNPSAIMVGLLSSRPKNLSNLDISQENDVLVRYEYWQTVALTPETLPDDPELMSAFGMIVLDDTDPALLTEKQQSFLKEWVKQGHVLICGGGAAAPRNLAFLADMTGLRAGEFTVSDGVHQALESYAGRKATGRFPEVVLSGITGADPMISDAKGNGLIWRSVAGNGRIYTLAWEAGDPALNSESLMHLFYQQMLINADSALYSNILYSQAYNEAAVTSGESSRIPVRSALTAAALIVAGMALAGGAAWVALKKHGASKWMWVVMPVLALITAGAVTWMAAGSSMNRTVASVQVNMVQHEDGTTKRYTTVAAASPRTGLHSYSMDGEKLQTVLMDNYYYMDKDEDDKPKEPVTLRMIHRSGGRDETVLNARSPWEYVQMYSVRAETETGTVQAEIWMEGDGLHGTVTNGTGNTLKEGTVLCLFGYALIPDLAPGESADFALIAEDAPDPYNPVFADGKMIRNTGVNLYRVASQRWFGQNAEDYTDIRSAYCGMVTGAASQLAQDRLRAGGSDRESAVFLYSAMPEGTEDIGLYADGEKPESLAVHTMLNVEMKYLPVGRTGVVFRAPGMDRAIRCKLTENGLPSGDMYSDGGSGGKSNYDYYPLSEKPTFRFAPDGLQDMEITRMTLGVEEWCVSDTKCYLLNVKQQIWVEVAPNTPVQRPEQYVDRSGYVYCQFRPAAGESYLEIPEPTLTLEGRVKDAQP